MSLPSSGARVGYVGTEIIGDVLTKANFDKGPGGLVGYGQIIPQSIIDLPPHGILNVHASLLPLVASSPTSEHVLLKVATSLALLVQQYKY